MKSLRKIFEAFGWIQPRHWIDQALADPSTFTDKLRERVFSHQDRFDFSAPVDYPHQVLTRHGRVITPLRPEHAERTITRTRRGVYGRIAMTEFAGQPRVGELLSLIAQHCADDLPVLDMARGKVSTKSALSPFAEIDTATELCLFRTAAQLYAIRRNPQAQQCYSHEVIAADGTRRAYVIRRQPGVARELRKG